VCSVWSSGVDVGRQATGVGHAKGRRRLSCRTPGIRPRRQHAPSGLFCGLRQSDCRFACWTRNVSWERGRPGLLTPRRRGWSDVIRPGSGTAPKAADRLPQPIKDRTSRGWIGRLGVLGVGRHPAYTPDTVFPDLTRPVDLRIIQRSAGTAHGSLGPDCQRLQTRNDTARHVGR